MEDKDQVFDIKEMQAKKPSIDKTLIKKLMWIISLVFDTVIGLIKIPFLSMLTLHKMLFPNEKNVQGQLVLVNCVI